MNRKMVSPVDDTEELRRRVLKQKQKSPRFMIYGENDLDKESDTESVKAAKK